MTDARARNAGDGRARSGQALVEFALIAVVELALVVGVVQGALLFYAWGVVLPTAVQDGAMLAASRGATPEDGRRRAIDLLAAGGVGRLGSWEVTAEDLGDSVLVRAEGRLPLVLPLRGAAVPVARRHAALKEEPTP